MNILLTNDDGYDAPGILAIRDLLKEMCPNNRVIIVAPEKEMSGTSHSITFLEGVEVTEIEKDVFVSKGTPADCVKFGLLSGVLPKIDLVISGINLGANLGWNIYYSGTVAGAREATFHKVPGIAISINSWLKKTDLTLCKEQLKLALEDILESAFGYIVTPLYNINIPLGVPKGFKYTYISPKTTQTKMKVQKNYLGYEEKYKTQIFNKIITDDDDDADFGILAEGYITIAELRNE